MRKSFLIDWLLYVTVKIMVFFVRMFPPAIPLFCGRLAGNFIYSISNRKRKTIAYSNLKLAFCEKKSPSELLRITKRAFQNLAQMAVEVLILPKINLKYVDKYIQMEGIEIIKEANEKKKGTILLTAHFGNWELSNIVSAIKGYPLRVLARTQKYNRLNSLLNSYREAKGCKVISKGMQVREIIGSLKANEMIGILLDQDGGKGGKFVKLFGRLTSTHAGPIRLALTHGSSVIPSFIMRKKGPWHRIVVEAPLKLQNSGNLEADIEINLQNFTNILESYISSYPDQWLWMHRRWKSTPNRSVLILSDGKAGHLNQSLAVLKAIERANDMRVKEDYPVQNWHEKSGFTTHKIVEVRFKNKFTRTLFTLCSIFFSYKCQGCMKCLKFCLRSDSYRELEKTYCDIVVSAGSSLCAVNLLLSKENGAKSIVLMKPFLFNRGKFDLAIIPRHDNTKMKKNTLITKATPNLIDAEYINHQAEKLKNKIPDIEFRISGERLRIGVFIGGETSEYPLHEGIMEKVTDELIKSADESNGEIFLTTSRRTSEKMGNLIKKRMTAYKRCKLMIIANEQNIEGVVGGILGLSDIVVVSADSISMISEAASSGKHVIVFIPSEITTKTKHAGFIKYLAEEKYITIAQPEKLAEIIKKVWQEGKTVNVLNDSEIICDTIRKML